MALATERMDIETAYALDGYEFCTEEFFPRWLKDAITDIRVKEPGIVQAEAEGRKRRPSLTRDGKLVILAADHPGRMVTKSGDDLIAMGDRLEYLGRVLRVAVSPEVDGIMATPDIIDDLFIVNYLTRQQSGFSFLDEKLLVGSMNRGGLAGAAFEMDDTMTAYSPQGVAARRLDAAKLMFRLDLNSYDSAQTLLYSAEAVRECNELGIPVFVESLPGTFVNNKWSASKNAEDLIKIVGVATALSDSSVNLWLKLPFVEGYDRVARATTCPILMLGGESKGDPTYTMQDFEKGLKAGGNVRGALVGRNVLFPGKDDPQAVARAISGMVHQGWSTLEAVRFLSAVRGEGMDWLTRKRRKRAKR